MKIGKLRFRPSPPVVVLTTAVVLGVGILFLGWINARRYRVNAVVEISDLPLSKEVASTTIALNAAGMPDGEVARLAVRVREATGLLMGLSVLALNEQIYNRGPAKAEGLVSLMSQRNLLPEGITPAYADAKLESERSTIYVRYRPNPLGVEVISIGREKLDGPGLIARLVAGDQDESAAVLLVAKKNDGVEIPKAFASLTEIAALNWSVEPLRERAVTPQELEELNNWAKKYAAGNR
jgi:hypothetical protein